MDRIAIVVIAVYCLVTLRTSYIFPSYMNCTNPLILPICQSCVSLWLGCAKNLGFARKIQINLHFIAQILAYSKYLLYLCRGKRKKD